MTYLIGAPYGWAGFSRMVMVVSVSFRAVSDLYSGIIGAECEAEDCFLNTNHIESFQFSQPYFLKRRQMMWIGQEMSLHSQCSFPICHLLIVEVQQLVPLCINHQHFLLAFMQLTHLSRPSVSSIYLSTSLPSNLLIFDSLNEITKIGDGVAFGEKYLCYKC